MGRFHGQLPVVGAICRWRVARLLFVLLGPACGWAGGRSPALVSARGPAYEEARQIAGPLGRCCSNAVRPCRMARTAAELHARSSRANWPRLCFKYPPQPRGSLARQCGAQTASTSSRFGGRRPLVRAGSLKLTPRSVQDYDSWPQACSAVCGSGFSFLSVTSSELNGAGETTAGGFSGPFAPGFLTMPGGAYNYDPLS